MNAKGGENKSMRGASRNLEDGCSANENQGLHATDGCEPPPALTALDQCLPHVHKSPSNPLSPNRWVVDHRFLSDPGDEGHQQGLFEVIPNDYLYQQNKASVRSENLLQSAQRSPFSVKRSTGKHTVLTDDGFPFGLSGGTPSDHPDPIGSNSRPESQEVISEGAGGVSSAMASFDDVVQNGTQYLKKRSQGTLQRASSHLKDSLFHSPVLEEDVMREKIISEQFNSLSSDSRRLELLHIFCERYFLPFERRRSFTADTWDELKLMGLRHKCCDIQFDWKRFSIYITIFRRQYRFFLFSFVLRALCLFLFWLFMYCLVSTTEFSPGGLYFDTIATVAFSGIVGSIMSKIIRIPSLVCVTAAGILYNNIPTAGYLTSGITSTMYLFAGMFGFSVGVLRAGLSLNVMLFKREFVNYMLFGLLPLSAEAVLHSMLCKVFFGYPNYAWAFLQGFIASAIAPSVVVPILIDMQREGYRIRDGPAMMILSSISIDTSLCVWAIQFLLAFEFNTMSLTLAIVLGILQMVIGILVGVLLGFMVNFFIFHVLFFEAERVSLANGAIMRMTVRHATHVRYTSLSFMMLLSLASVSLGRYISCLGGGAVCALTMATVFNYLCVRSGSSERLQLMADLSQMLTTLWDYVAMPSMFAFAGASVNVDELFTREFIGVGCAVVFAGLAARFIFAMLTPIITRMHFTWREILFCGIGWLGKGSVQGALGSAALLYAQEELGRATTPEAIASAEQRVRYGQTVKNTAVLSMLIACPLCSILLGCFAHKLLKRDPDAVEAAAPAPATHNMGDEEEEGGECTSRQA